MPLIELGREVGLQLGPGRALPWLSPRGHLETFVLRSTPPEIIETLATIHRNLGGSADLLASKRRGAGPTPDLVHVPTGIVIEVDELQHFTNARLRSLELYPSDAPLGFDIEEYRTLCATWASRADRAFRHRVSTDFPQAGGRTAQRAYNDALRDLLAPTHTGFPIVRVPVPDRDLAGAAERVAAAIPDFGSSAEVSERCRAVTRVFVV